MITSYASLVSISTLGSSLGTGGMETKLIAAEIATETGVTAIITSSKQPDNIFGIIEYHNSLKFASSSSTSPVRIPGSLNSSATFARPPHTVFEPSSSPLRDIKSWTSHTLFPSGTVVIDAGAHQVLSRRESGGRLLPAGVLKVIGAFASGQAVRIAIRRPIGGGQSEDPEAARAAYLDGMAMTRASTPTLVPAASTTSPISSLDPLSNSMSSMGLSETTHVPENEEVSVVREGVSNTWEEVEIGRGLANYNSAQITKVKGLNRWVDYHRDTITCSCHYSSYISQLLEYNDSDYVVESISLRIKSHET
jgi:glutamate 5-kinase